MGSGSSKIKTNSMEQVDNVLGSKDELKKVKEDFGTLIIDYTQDVVVECIPIVGDQLKKFFNVLSKINTETAASKLENMIKRVVREGIQDNEHRKLLATYRSAMTYLDNVAIENSDDENKRWIHKAYDKLVDATNTAYELANRELHDYSLTTASIFVAFCLFAPAEIALQMVVAPQSTKGRIVDIDELHQNLMKKYMEYRRDNLSIGKGYHKTGNYQLIVKDKLNKAFEYESDITTHDPGSMYGYDWEDDPNKTTKKKKVKDEYVNFCSKNKQLQLHMGSVSSKIKTKSMEQVDNVLGSKDELKIHIKSMEQVDNVLGSKDELKKVK
jgi:hypothetical protein